MDHLYFCDNIELIGIQSHSEKWQQILNTTLKVTAFEKGGAWVKAPRTGKAGDLRGVLQCD